MKSILKISFILLVTCTLLTCQKWDWNNPYDDKPPTVTTNNVSNVTQTTATVSATAIGINTEMGVCYSTINPNPTINDTKIVSTGTTESYTIKLSNLTTDQTFYIRAYAINNKGISYGNSLTFNTIFVEDIDGNIYHAVQIGNQIWMVENLKTTHYRNGDPILNVTDNTEWSNLTTGAYCWYGNIIAYREPYGALYNWHTVNDSRNICPEGWHVPSDAEWTTLTNFLGGESVAGRAMKETGTAHWQSPNTGATNSSGFTALPGGYRDYSFGTFSYMTYSGGWWSSTAFDASDAWYRGLFYPTANASRDFNSMRTGFSVRCVRD